MSTDDDARRSAETIDALTVPTGPRWGKNTGPDTPLVLEVRHDARDVTTHQVEVIAVITGTARFTLLRATVAPQGHRQAHADVAVWTNNGWQHLAGHPIEETGAYAALRRDPSAVIMDAGYADAIALLQLGCRILTGSLARVDDRTVR